MSKGNKASTSKKGSKKERVSLMKKVYLEYHEKGLSPCEIAKKLGVSKSTIYRCLDEIAEENGVDRDTLLGRKKGGKEKVQEEKVEKTAPADSNYSDPQELYKRLAAVTLELEAMHERIKQNRMQIVMLDEESKQLRNRIYKSAKQLDRIKRRLDEQ